MRDVNKVILMGHLGGDPVKRTTKAGKNIVEFPMATNRKYKGGDGEVVEKTDWHKVVVWGKQADHCFEYLKRGSALYLEGTLEATHWQDGDGKDRKSFQVIAQHTRFIGERRVSSESMSAESHA